MDLRSGFLNVKLSERARDLSAFILPNGRIFKGLVMPFGFGNAPAVFQELSNQIVANVKRQPAYQQMQGSTDNIEDHLTLLRICLEEMRSTVKVKLPKYHFLQPSLEFLGFEVHHVFWKPSSTKCAAIKDAIIKDLRSLRGFIGACNFYRRHVKGFSQTSAILTNPTKKDTKWHFGPEEQSAVDQLKEALLTCPGLGVPQGEGEFLLVTDASDIGGGGSIYQWQSRNQMTPPGTVTSVNSQGHLNHSYGDNWWLVPIGHYAWTWNNFRQNYSTYEQEVLAAVLVLASQQRIIAGRKLVWLSPSWRRLGQQDLPSVSVVLL